MKTTSVGLRIAVLDALDRWRAELPPDYDPPFLDSQVEWAIKAVDSVGLVGHIDDWFKESYKGPGGRPRGLSVQALFVALLLTVVAGKGLQFRLITNTLYYRLSPDMKTRLGVGPATPAPGAEYKAAYQRARRLFWDVLALMDPSGQPKNRVLKKTELEAATRPMSAAEVTEAYRRLDLICNLLIEASIKMLPRFIRRHWKGSVSLDATPVPTYAQGTGAESEYASCDPDAGWYVRDGDHKGPDTLRPASGGKGLKRNDKRKKIRWAYEATFAVMGPEAPEQERLFPRLIVGMACHTPGFDPAGNGLRVLRSIHDRGHPASWLATDRLYMPDASPEDFKLIAEHKLGYKPIFVYRKDQLGVREAAHGAKLLASWFYCPGTPKNLLSVYQDFQAEKINLDTFRSRLDELKKYRVRPKEGYGGTAYFCPAEGARRTVNCPVKPAEKDDQRLHLPLIVDVPKRLPDVCTTTRVTIDRVEGAKYRQELQYGSDKHHGIYTVLRETVEGANGTAKRCIEQDLESTPRRPGRGIAAVHMYTALILFSENLRRIQRFAVAAEAADDGSVVVKNPRKTPRRRSRPADGKFYRRKVVMPAAANAPDRT